MSVAARERRGLLLAFTVFGCFWGSWAAVLPDVRARSGLDDGGLGLALGAIAVAALPAMPLAGRLADRHGARRLLPAGLAVFACVTALLGFARGPVALVGGLLLLGAVAGAVDVTLNAAAAAWERLTDERLLTYAHGCFSLGVLGASSLTGVARSLSAGPPLVLSCSAALLLVSAACQPAYRRVPAGALVSGRRRLGPVLLGLAAVVGASFLIEDAVESWSALHLERDLDAVPWVSGLAPGLFAGAMAVGRLGTHAYARQVRAGLVVATGGLVTAAGLLMLALAPGAPLALVGAAVGGAGVSVLGPTLLSAVGARSSPGRQGADLALVTAFGYTGFVIGPVAVGLLSAALSLTAALALLAVLAVGAAVTGPLLLGRPAAVSERRDGAEFPATLPATTRATTRRSS